MATMIRSFIAFAILVTANVAQAQLSMMGIGPAGLGPPLAACGAGVVDLSQGCSLPIALGLIP